MVVVLQGLALLGFAGVREFTLRTGREVVLQTVPVDPRDLFRGDYVVLRYDVSRLPYCCFKVGDRVYVTLASKGEVWEAVSASKRAPSGDGIFIRGRVAQLQDERGTQYIEVEYGIESYFVPEGTGRDIERFQGKMKVIVAVDGFGTAVIKELILE